MYDQQLISVSNRRDVTRRILTLAIPITGRWLLELTVTHRKERLPDVSTAGPTSHLIWFSAWTVELPFFVRRGSVAATRVFGVLAHPF